uniref:hypothetical protein n=1 Tax=Mariniflexile sp. TaxID=1979402 RepID=UPI00404852FA
MPFLRTPYNYDRNAASDASGLHCPDRSRTKQADAVEADINTIVRRFNLTGQLPQGLRAPIYGDFGPGMDFHTAQNALRAAQTSFMALPAEIRSRFHNDPGEFVAFCSDQENAPQMAKWGLLATQASDLMTPSTGTQSVPTGPTGPSGPPSPAGGGTSP